MSWQSGGPESPPNVYLPQGDADATPAYEAYADPAAAHGWQDSYAHGGDGAHDAHAGADPYGEAGPYDGPGTADRKSVV